MARGRAAAGGARQGRPLEALRRLARRSIRAAPVAMGGSALYMERDNAQTSDRSRSRRAQYLRCGVRPSSSRKQEPPPCTKSPVRFTGTSRQGSSALASASSIGRRPLTTCSWNPRTFRSTATSASARCRTCRSSRGSAWAAAAPTFSCTAPRASGAATWSRCRAPARSMPKSTCTRRSISSSRAAARPRSGSTATTSATFSNGRRDRCSRSRSTPCTASSTPARHRRCFLAAPPRRT